MERSTLTSRPKGGKDFVADDSSEPFSPEVQKQLAVLSNMAAAFDQSALKMLLADDPSITKPDHQRLALAMLNVLKLTSGFSQKKRSRLFMKILEVLPYPD